VYLPMWVGIRSQQSPSPTSRRSQALRTSFKAVAVRWFPIEPILTDRLETARMTRNINSVKAQTIDAG
jgi:hypothetical protein